MKTKLLLMIVIVLVLGAGTIVVLRPGSQVATTTHDHAAPGTPSTTTAQHADNPPKHRVPAYQRAAEVKNLPPTLAASAFVGKAREAYEVAKEIPQTLAQLPCYCECDRGFGHKSLHTCFVDDHASHCAVCVDEALLAYKLQRDQKLTPDQVREIIIEKYSAEHQHQ